MAVSAVRDGIVDRQKWTRGSTISSLRRALSCGSTRLAARSTPVQVDFERLLRADTMIGVPGRPAWVTNSLSLLGWLDDKLHLVNRFLPFVHSPS